MKYFFPSQNFPQWLSSHKMPWCSIGSVHLTQRNATFPSVFCLFWVLVRYVCFFVLYFGHPYFSPKASRPTTWPLVHGMVDLWAGFTQQPGLSSPSLLYSPPSGICWDLQTACPGVSLLNPQNCAILNTFWLFLTFVELFLSFISLIGREREAISAPLDRVYRDY